ncbi:hypothetical protein PSI9734_00615 [Pseudidiomarina piscicola]|uniref:DUF192 domain-containing protein n=1 Tax=Pseudidiomarina piscicola TaxID=2614830 RepID=A0A6S6WLK1_9GAMM|nr:DUF192 domain-containing protein [Pseudidiomarina piscicola]CAB0150044.1 hypothetical protein PSI9734_00615 [Pseudidiomarina piscicola]VZT39488.1 hypothetical protein PSI9734_00615 [Pseudomonas aeruginosa]
MLTSAAFMLLIGLQGGSTTTLASSEPCSADADAVCHYETAQLCAAPGQPPMQVEIADTPAKRERGLMFRESLADHHGMWFVYQSERPSYAGFWMFNTKLPLDIAYLDQSMTVVKVFTMRPCTSVNPRNCPAYRPGETYWGALEMPAGYFERHGIQQGSQLQQCKTQENNR